MTQKINNRQTFVLNKNNHRNENNNGIWGVKEGAFGNRFHSVTLLDMRLEGEFNFFGYSLNASAAST